MGCANSSPSVITKLQVEKELPPQEWLVCTDDPDVPDGNIDDKALAQYVKDLWAAGDNCRSNINNIHDWSDNKKGS